MQSASLANGPKGRTIWDLVDWREAGESVTNLRQRIFKAARANDLRKVRSLQKLMLMIFRIRVVSDLLEPCEAKVSSTVLRGGGGGDAPALPGR